MTRTEVDAGPARFAIAPSSANGMQVRSYAMVDKIAAVPKAKFGRRIGVLEAREISLLDLSFILFLGLAE